MIRVFCSRARHLLLSQDGQLVQTFTERLLMYATGRKLEYYDMPTVRRIVRGAAGDGYRFSALVQAIVRSEQFRKHRVSQPAPGEIANSSPSPGR